MFASGFVGGLSRVNNVADITVSVADIARATYFLGATSLRKCGRPTTVQRQKAALHVQAMLKENGGGLVASAEYYGGLSDEKRMASFFVGMAMSKLFAEKELKAPYCITVEKGVRHKVITLGRASTSKSLPDVVATNGGLSAWHVLEAKGRLTATETTACEAKKQAKRVRTVNAKNPATKCGCAVSLENLAVFAVDPADGGSQDLQIDRHSFFDELYGWFVRSPIPKKSIAVERVDGRVVLLDTPSQGVTSGLHSAVFEWALGGYKGAPPSLASFSAGPVSLGADGWMLQMASSISAGHE